MSDRDLAEIFLGKESPSSLWHFSEIKLSLTIRKASKRSLFVEVHLSLLQWPGNHSDEL
jgi:hypothetical protein